MERKCQSYVRVKYTQLQSWGKI